MAVIFSLSISQNSFAHHVLENIPVSENPMGMSLTDDFLYVSSFQYPHIDIIDIDNNKNVDFITTSSSGIMAVEAVPDKNKIYAAPFESGGIDVYSLSTRLLIKTIPLSGSEIDFPTTSNQPYGQRSDVHFVTGGWSLDYNPTNEIVYVADYNSNNIHVIDTKTDEIIQTISVPRHPFTVRADPLSNTVMVASLAGNEITFLEDVTDEYSVRPIYEVAKTIKMSGGPWGLELDPLHHLAYVTNRGCECITVINILEKEIVGEIPLGDKAMAIAVDTDEHVIYASYLTQNKIVKIDGQTNKIKSKLDLQSHPWGMEVNPKSHKVYVALKSEDKVLVLGPTSYSIHLPVLTLQIPSALVGLIHVHGQDVTASNAIVDVVNTELLMNVGTEDGGKITVSIPRYVLDSKMLDTDLPFEVIVDGKSVKHQESLSPFNDRIISLQVEPNSKILSITGSIISEETREPLQTFATPIAQEPSLSKGYDIVCEGKVWVESITGKIACTFPSTAKKLVERGWGTILE
ncbi:MAG: YncE family protein [Candidatus Nitrosopumilus sp. bin_68KS]